MSLSSASSVILRQEAILRARKALTSLISASHVDCSMVSCCLDSLGLLTRSLMIGLPSGTPDEPLLSLNVELVVACYNY